MKELTSSIPDFEKLIKEGYLYVDKTEYIWNLINPAGESYFLSRPRRFGKSLTVSTLEAIFRGRKDLFKGLAIYDKDYDWKEYPIIHLSFGDYNVVSDALLELPDYLMAKVQRIAEEHGIQVTGTTPGLRFGDLIDKLSSKSSVVILVDEYDKPILDNISDSRIKEIQKCLKGFFSILKDRNKLERLLFVTGVSKFAQVSLFSDLNNLTDISMDSRYACLCGYTQEEFESYFAEYINMAAKKLDMSRKDFLQEMKRMYDGYRFSKNAETVYNPVSVAKFFNSQEPDFSYYWFETGTPAFLLDYCRKTNYDFETKLKEPIPAIAFSAYDVDNISPSALLYQTGYLTIKDAFTKNRRTYYQMQFPNDEVAWAFEVYLLKAYTGVQTEDITTLASSLVDSIATGNADEVMALIKSFFSKIPYPIQIEDEKYYQSLFYAIFILLKVDIEAEACTNDGRIDATSAAGDWRFIFEFKLNKTAEIALDQIEKKEYFQKYRNSGKRIMLVGANFSFEKRQITEWISKEYIP